MKKLIAVAMGAAMLFRVAKKHGVHNFKEFKALFTSELNNVGQEVKHQLVS